MAGRILPRSTLDFDLLSALPSWVTFTRNSTGTYFDLAGVLQSAAIDVARFDHVFDGTNWVSKGLLPEEASTNEIRNNTMQGAVAGTPGTDPTNWTITSGGTTVTISGLTTINGIDYIDVRFNGTATSNPAVAFETNTGIPALTGETWTLSAWLATIAGDNTNITEINLLQQEYNVTPAIVANQLGPDIKGDLTSTITRFTSPETLAGGVTVTSVQPLLVVQASGAIDITLRIGLPQMEEKAFATSVIPTTTAVVTRAVDVATISDVSWLNANVGTLYAESTLRDLGESGRITELSDGTLNERILIGRSATDNYQFFMSDGGVSQVNSQTIAHPDNTTSKVIFAWALNDLAFTADGAAVLTDGAATIATITQLDIGIDLAGGNVSNGHIGRIVYIPARLPNAQLEALAA